MEELIQKTVNTMEAIAADLPLNEPFVVNTSKISKYDVCFLLRSQISSKFAALDKW